MINQCPLCKHRVSDWQMACGKTKEVGPNVVHKSCLIDYELRHGRSWEDQYYHDHPEHRRKAS